MSFLELASLFRNADLTIYPSYYEGQGLIPLESMSSGTPVVTVNHGPLPEMVDSTVGALFTMGDIDSMAKNAIKILSDDSLEKKYRNQAFENAKKYDIKTVIPLYEKIYDEALNMS